MEEKISRREFIKLVSLLPLAASGLPRLITQPSAARSGGGPNIIILVFDALSAQNASIYGYRRETTPNLAKFAERATVYHSHNAGGNFTSSGTASLLTGTYPWTHRAFHLHGSVLNEFENRNLFSLFGEPGYNRIGYSHNYLAASLLYQFRENLDQLKWTRELCLEDDLYSDRVFSRDFNVAFWSEWLELRGGETAPSSLFLSLFHRFLRSTHKRSLTRELGELFPRGVPNLHNMFFILEDAIDWLMQQLVSLHQPYLIYFHVLPPHEPYTTRRDFVDVFSDGWAPDEKPARFFSEGHSSEFLLGERREYDEYLAYADAEFGRLCNYMGEHGIFENSYVLFTSDHGEMFERGIRGHVTEALYDPLTRIPLLVSSPGQLRREDIYTPTSCVDVIPTLLHLTGQTIPDWLEGQVLPPYNIQAGSRDNFSVEAKSNPKMAPLNKATISLVRGSHKLIHYTGYKEDTPKYELFDLGNDPQERVDLYADRKAVASELTDILMERLQTANQPFRS